jgi:hypothetical protein
MRSNELGHERYISDKSWLLPDQDSLEISGAYLLQVSGYAIIIVFAEL